METLTAAWEFFQTAIQPHWPWFSWMIFCVLTGQVMSKVVFSRDAVLKNKPTWFFWWGRKTLVLHPIVASIAPALLWQDPEGMEWKSPFVSSLAYYSVAGGLSTWAYEAIRGLAKKQGIDLTIPGIDNVSVTEVKTTEVTTTAAGTTKTAETATKTTEVKMKPDPAPAAPTPAAPTVSDEPEPHSAADGIEEEKS